MPAGTYQTRTGRDRNGARYRPISEAEPRGRSASSAIRAEDSSERVAGVTRGGVGANSDESGVVAQLNVIVTRGSAGVTFIIATRENFESRCINISSFPMPRSSSSHRRLESKNERLRSATWDNGLDLLWTYRAFLKADDVKEVLEREYGEDDVTSEIVGRSELSGWRPTRSRPRLEE